MSCNEERRLSNELLAGQHAAEASVRVITKKVRDTIVIVLMTKKRSDATLLASF
jgi:hypothetical protein